MHDKAETCVKTSPRDQGPYMHASRASYYMNAWSRACMYIADLYPDHW